MVATNRSGATGVLDSISHAADQVPSPGASTSEILKASGIIRGGFSIEERDRRWRTVRQAARISDFDCLVVPRAVGGVNLCLSLEQVRGAWSDARYLTMLEDAVVVLPVDGRDPIVITPAPDSNRWIEATRTPSQAPIEPTWPLVVDALNELGMGRGRIGVVGMKGGKYTHTRAYDGVVAHTSLTNIRSSFPRASFEDATDLLGVCRSQKGPEEVQSLALGSRIAEEAIKTFRDTCHVGMDESEMYALVMARFLELGSDYYSLGFRTGPIGVRYWRIVEPRREHPILENQFFQLEFDSLINGLISQEAQPMVFGEVPASWKKMIALHEDFWWSSFELMRPGNNLGTLIDFCRAYGPKNGLRSSDILMHGRGYGNDGPLLTPSDPGTRSMRDIEFAPGNVFVWKPTVGMDEPGRNGNRAAMRFGWGGNVVVTEDGPKRLFARSHGLISIQ
jgi:Xaa-Pro aminopeptidase